MPIKLRVFSFGLPRKRIKMKIFVLRSRDKEVEIVGQQKRLLYGCPIEVEFKGFQLIIHKINNFGL